MSVAHRVGGPVLDISLSLILLLGSVGSGVAGQTGASRLLYGMGRDGVIPVKIFGHLDKKHSSPSYNVMIIGVLALIGAIMLNYEECARLINFGAFFAFMCVNIAAMKEYYFKPAEKTVKSFIYSFLPPAIGFIICLIIWLNLPVKTFIIGGGWMGAGILYLAVQTKGFREKNPLIDFSERDIENN
jgi:amino acid transporter